MAIGKFITFEGGEGCGKSTQSALLCKALEHANIPHIHTREPGGTEGAEAIRSLLVTGDINRWDSMTELLLHFAARRDHLTKVIKPSLEQGTWVICDRYVHSTIAYQGYGHGLSLETIKMISNLVIGRVKPCLTVVLDADPAIALARTHQRTHNETRYEAMEHHFHHRLRQGFLELSKTDTNRFITLDATDDIQSIQDAIRQRIYQQFALF